VTHKDLITSGQACELLGINRATLSRAVKTGRITPAWSMPGLTGARLFRRRDVKALKGKIGKAS
jgi:excisionase family DNA binding protein